MGHSSSEEIVGSDCCLEGVAENVVLLRSAEMDFELSRLERLDPELPLDRDRLLSFYRRRDFSPDLVVPERCLFIRLEIQ